MSVAQRLLCTWESSADSCSWLVITQTVLAVQGALGAAFQAQWHVIYAMTIKDAGAPNCQDVLNLYNETKSLRLSRTWDTSAVC